MTKNKIINVLFFICIFVFFFLIEITNAKFASYKKSDNVIDIAKPIINIENVSSTNIENIIPGQEVEYYFNIKNTDENSTLNQVNMNYYIKLTAQDTSLPLTYNIYDVTSGTEQILPMDSGQTAIMSIGYKEVETHKYKIKFMWPSNENSSIYANKNMSFSISVCAEQVV